MLEKTVVGKPFDIKGLAEFLGMGARTVNILVKAGKIPGLKIGGRWRFDLEAIRRWMAKEMAKNLVHQ
ncbi:MAG: helix-turn-helix domain-containing protein [Planctomycetes bacterium]|nr:helix-turn-helix domain-containing protein [Planctomycetota bacterium]MCK5579542.1 helix-turn-helix domain-containing protein [Planctomycetota bacterium]